jgi:pimeloyl-ACP methyl ester carboxylesterase
MQLTRFSRALLLTGLLPLAACGGVASSEAPATAVAMVGQGYFFVGGRYTQTKDGQIMTGQMFVQYQIPAERRHPYPIVMWHGGGQTGTNFIGTPDGRPGWADYFLQQGYAVYVVDQPARARSGFFTEVYGTTTRPTTQNVSDRFTAPEAKGLYPQAALHTQWPGTGAPGNVAFDQFFASQVEGIADVGVVEALNRDAGVALLDRIGPAILLTHSQSGPFGWALADARPRLVRAILAIEPNGPPFHENVTVGAPDWFKDGPLARAWGIARTQLTYAPAVEHPGDLRPARQDRPDGADLVRCWLQPEPARQLPNLQQIPIVIVVSEASYHAPYDHCTSRYLQQAGVRHEFVRLADVGIRGNGHMMMLEQNNLAIAAWLERWAARIAPASEEQARAQR